MNFATSPECVVKRGGLWDFHRWSFWGGQSVPQHGGTLRIKTLHCYLWPMFTASWLWPTRKHVATWMPIMKYIFILVAEGVIVRLNVKAAKLVFSHQLFGRFFWFLIGFSILDMVMGSLLESSKKIFMASLVHSVLLFNCIPTSEISLDFSSFNCIPALKIAFLHQRWILLLFLHQRWVWSSFNCISASEDEVCSSLNCIPWSMMPSSLHNKNFPGSC